MKKILVDQVFARFKKANTNPTTELSYSNEFELLIAVILSAQSTDIQVNKVMAKLLTVAKTPRQIVDLGEKRLKKYISSIGLYNNKARNIILSCRILVDKYNEQVPQTREELEKLPGVGRKTANVVLNTAFDYETIAVDTHIFRVANRTGIAPGQNVFEVEKKLLQRIPQPYKKNAHHWLILHGRYICKARTPLCAKCIIMDICDYKYKSVNVS